MTTDKRPQLAGAATKPASDGGKKVNVGQFLMQPENMQRIAAVVPRHLTAERMLRVAAHAVTKTKNLDQVPLAQLVGGIMMLSSLGLEPNTVLGHAYLIPFAKRIKEGTRWIEAFELQVIIGYKGYLELMRRSGQVISVHADVVYKGDTFSFEYGTNQHLKHIPQGDSAGREATHAYCYAKLKDGEAFDVLPYPRVLAIRNGSQGYQAALKSKSDAEANQADAWKMKTYLSSPWVQHEHEMASKTMVRRLAKMMPMSIEIQNAMEHDSAQEQGKTIDYATFSDVDFTSPLDLGAEEETTEQKVVEHNPGEQVGQTGGAAAKEKEPAQSEPRKEAAKPPAAKKVEEAKKEAPPPAKEEGPSFDLV